jgi:hypothetical protein
VATHCKHYLGQINSTSGGDKLKHRMMGVEKRDAKRHEERIKVEYPYCKDGDM